MSIQSVVLRNTRDPEEGSRHLQASMTAVGDLVIEGQDLGDSVERALGVREYEWIWTVRAPHVPVLASALGGPGDVLSALEERFRGENAAGLKSFLDSQGIPHEVWSRMGD
jgi:hypothetical protein